MANWVTTDSVRDRGWLHNTKGGNTHTDKGRQYKHNTKGGYNNTHIQTTGSNKVHTHTDKGRKYTKQNITLDQTQSCYTIHTGVYTGC